MVKRMNVAIDRNRYGEQRDTCDAHSTKEYWTIFCREDGCGLLRSISKKEALIRFKNKDWRFICPFDHASYLNSLGIADLMDWANIVTCFSVKGDEDRPNIVTCSSAKGDEDRPNIVTCSSAKGDEDRPYAIHNPGRFGTITIFTIASILGIAALICK